MFAAIVIVAAAVSRVPLKRMVLPLIPVVILAVFTVVFAVVPSPDLAGLSNGLFMAVRMVFLVAASLVVSFTTTATALLRAFAWLIGPLRSLRVPVDDIAFTLSLALRFIPVIGEEVQTVRTAQLARGGALPERGFMRRLSVWGAAFSAVFVGLFRHADSLATAMDSRCYGMADRRTSLH